jgi:hypothetical protein
MLISTALLLDSIIRNSVPMYVCTVVNQNKIGQSVTLDSFTIQRFV